MSGTITIDPQALPEGFGAPKPIEVPATRYHQGGRQMFSIVLTVEEITHILQKPDPDQPMEGNRKVDPARARKFGIYIRDNEDWVSPGIIVKAPIGEIDFKAIQQFGNGTAWGVLSIPLHVLKEILLLDGQHRTLGSYIFLEEINDQIRQKRDMLARAEKNGEVKEVGDLARKALDRCLKTRERVLREHISIDVALVTTDQAKQMFADIANNAKGISPDFTTVLDQREVTNRAAMQLIEEHALLKGRVELGQSARMTATNPNLIGAKTVADIVRAVHVGISGRVGRGIEEELSNNMVKTVEKVSRFLDVLVAGFDDLKAVVDGDIEAPDLRDDNSPNRSMVGSATMLRVLAGAYHELSKKPENGAGPQPLTRSEFEEFFKKLAPMMRRVPIDEHDALWMPTGAFVPGSSAPQARQGSMTGLVRHIATWARNGHAELA
jgi:hypothetical protein